MTLRLEALAGTDPLAVPLPSGTEVTTPVDRHFAIEGGSWECCGDSCIGGTCE